ncbi:DNA polymerase-3 subunit epsilon [Chitinophaga costaii]|uniref:DNA polymerase-3 subunit epsilon n=1 Tax=Chitinophaga costaii TaxID=1335309 RepID=A0A1C4FC01_9BACT|nr:exonuclease domain-containing protein [Chitinophaga costaii]PUZ20692.1 DNA polymerase III subunit epsilon [Chitinophaga costaii]SCC53539.1 DNA polymerase-3 subunit epsilon [Chitinophaga costaii]
MYAIVDIETTGGHARANGITEIAIFVHDGHQVIERYETLVNPGKPIPYYIQSLTGITNEMVEDAPFFEEVAPRVYELLRNNIFIAHNVNFDYSFIHHHLQGCGYDLHSKKLCTVRMSRKVIPGLPSYSLGKLCRSLNISLHDRHRAAGDAEATVRLFERLLASDNQQHIPAMLKRGSKEHFLPPNLAPEYVTELPGRPGVYYFHDQKGKVLYVGKAKDLKKRVNSHFTGNNSSQKRQEFLRNIYSVSYETTGTELMACILESVEIKRLWPVYNQSQKRAELRYGFYTFEDQQGYLRLAIEKKRKYTQPLLSFDLLAQGQQWLRRLIREFHLCPKLCFLQTDHDPCTGLEDETCLGACEKKEAALTYNHRVLKAIQSLRAAQPSFIILGSGRNVTEQSAILMESGRFYGMGYVPIDAGISDPAALRDLLTPYPENEYIINLVKQYAENNMGSVIRC